MYHRLGTYIITVAMLLASVQAAAAPQEESRHIPAAGIGKVALRGIRYTGLAYTGIPGAKSFTVCFSGREPGAGERENREFSRVEIETEVSGSTLVIRLRGGDIPKRFFREHERDYRLAFLEITGPAAVDLDIDANHSEARIRGTEGNLAIDSKFGETTVSGHNGRLRVHTRFGVFRGDGLRGSFDLACGFGETQLAVEELRGDSGMNVSFGSGKISLPRNQGADFRLTRSFGGIELDLPGAEGEPGTEAWRVVNGGGPRVNLSTRFGEIRVSDSGPDRRTAYRRVFSNGGVMPLAPGSRWQYARNGETRTLTVAGVRAEFGQAIATLAFDNIGDAPFGSIDVFETERGLFLWGINRNFLGRDLTGLILNPPRIWLPYRAESSPVTGGDLIGTVRIESFPDTVTTPAGTFENVITYAIQSGNGAERRIQIEPGVGMISFDGAQLTEYTLGEAGEIPPPSAAPPGTEQPEAEQPPEAEQQPLPAFTGGELSSIEIVGNRFRSDYYINRKLDLRVGESYTIEEIEEAVNSLQDDVLIDYASFSVDTNGNLRIYIYEKRPFDADLGARGIFTRVSGFGLGPELRIASTIAPISEVGGFVRYDWGTEDWAWGVDANRKFFFPMNPLVIGGGYRDDYGSNMDWVIPQTDADLNAFFIGRAVKNYYREEKSYGFIALPQIGPVRTRAEYFESRYSSVEKETDWSLFSRSSTKRPNPPLGPESEGFITGTRVSLEYRRLTTVMDFRSWLELERSYQGRSDAYPAYTRLLGYGSWNMKYWFGHLIKFRAVGGYSPHVLPDQRAFTLGGLNTLRGYDPLSVPEPPDGETPFTVFHGGDRMFLTNIDYFLGQGLSLIFFADLGGVWRKGEAVSTEGLRRDVGIGLAFGSDFFSSVDGEDKAGFRVNWAVPVGPVAHESHWTVNFVRSY